MGIARRPFIAGIVMAATGLATRPAIANWTPYLATLRNNRANGVKAAAIYGQDGALWAADIEARHGEIASLVAGLANVNLFSASGLVFGGVKYIHLGRRPPGGVVAKRAATHVLVRATTKAVLIVLTKDGADPSTVTSIDVVADDLIRKRM